MKVMTRKERKRYAKKLRRKRKEKCSDYVWDEPRGTGPTASTGLYATGRVKFVSGGRCK
jgi:hypothetical protein